MAVPIWVIHVVMMLMYMLLYDSGMMIVMSDGEHGDYDE